MCDVGFVWMSWRFRLCRSRFSCRSLHCAWAHISLYLAVLVGVGDRRMSSYNSFFLFRSRRIYAFMWGSLPRRQCFVCLDHSSVIASLADRIVVFTWLSIYEVSASIEFSSMASKLASGLWSATSYIKPMSCFNLSNRSYVLAIRRGAGFLSTSTPNLKKRGWWSEHRRMYPSMFIRKET